MDLRIRARRPSTAAATALLLAVKQFRSVRLLTSLSRSVGNVGMIKAHLPVSHFPTCTAIHPTFPFYDLYIQIAKIMCTTLSQPHLRAISTGFAAFPLTLSPPPTQICLLLLLFPPAAAAGGLFCGDLAIPQLGLNLASGRRNSSCNAARVSNQPRGCGRIWRATCFMQQQQQREWFMIAAAAADATAECRRSAEYEWRTAGADEAADMCEEEQQG